jgi:hypothetical protein
MEEGLSGVNVLKFADDTKVYCAITEAKDVANMQSNLNILGDWFKKWKMPVNVSKSGVVKFGSHYSIFDFRYALYNEELKETQKERDLGLIIDSTLSYKSHIQKSINEAMRRYGWIVRNLTTRNSVIVIRIYKTLIRPILEYASSVWSPTRVGLTHQLERVQRKVTKLVLRHLTYQERLRKLKLPTLKWRRTYLDLLRTYQIVHGDQQYRNELIKFSSEVTTPNLRRHRLTIYKANCNTNMYQNHLVNKATDLWNSLPHELLDISQYSSFKSKLKEYLLVCANPYIWP